jgi:hypothetical protein
MKIEVYPEIFINQRGCGDWMFNVLPVITIERDTPEYWFYFEWLVFCIKIVISKEEINN